jgi:hypothetical protein
MKISISLGTICIILAILKLCGVINISWIWILIPIWVPLLIWVLILAFGLYIATRK